MTLEWPQWIEAIFSVVPDPAGGEAEWAITLVLLVSVIGLFIAAQREWTRAASVSR